MNARHHDQKTYGARRMRAETATPDASRVPADPDCEAAFIADLLDQDQGGEALSVVRDHVTSKDFTVGTLGMFYEAIVSLRDAHAEDGESERPIGRSELAAWLRVHTAEPGVQPSGVYLTDAEADALRDMNGTEVTRSFERVANAHSLSMRVEARAARIRELAHQRRLIERLWTVAGVGCCGDPALFRDAFAELMVLGEEAYAPKKPESVHISNPIGRVLKRYLKPGAKHQTFVSTGNSDLDEILELEPGDLVIVGARSGRGKSVLALDWAKHVGKNLGPSLVFTGEMNDEQMSLRALCADARVDSHEVKRGRVLADTVALGKLNDSIRSLNESLIYMSDLPGIDVERLCGMARREAKRIKRETGKPLRLLVVDYLQRVRPGRLATPGASREQQVAAVAFALKELARELQIVIVSPSQLNADADARNDGGRPQVSDLRESKGIENEADAIILIHNPQYVERSRKVLDGEPLQPEPCELTVGKSRNGKLGTAYAWFMPPFTTFDPMTRDEVFAMKDERKSERRK